VVARVEFELPLTGAHKPLRRPTALRTGALFRVIGSGRANETFWLWACPPSPGGYRSRWGHRRDVGQRGATGGGLVLDCGWLCTPPPRLAFSRDFAVKVSALPELFSAFWPARGEGKIAPL